MSSKPTKPYELLPGKKHSVRVERRGVRRLMPGEICELTEGQAKSWRDKFRPVGDGFGGIRHPHVPEPEPPTAAPPAPKPVVTAEPAEDPEPKVNPPTPPAVSASDLIETIGKANRARTKAIHETESASGRPRKTVLAAAEERLEELRRR